MGSKVACTEPALLAGLWVLLAMQETLQQYSVAELQRFAAQAVAGLRPNSS
jgi:hypothetical protein